MTALRGRNEHFKKDGLGISKIEMSESRDRQGYFKKVALRISQIEMSALNTHKIEMSETRGPHGMRRSERGPAECAERLNIILYITNETHKQ